jgi:hypothetical protein
VKNMSEDIQKWIVDPKPEGVPQEQVFLLAVSHRVWANRAQENDAGIITFGEILLRAQIATGIQLHDPDYVQRLIDEAMVRFQAAKEAEKADEEVAALVVPMPAT